MIIKTNKLNFSFGHRQILYDLDLQVPNGSIYGFLGPNGAGKTTTIKALLGLLRVKEGMVSIVGKDIRKDRIAILAKTGNMVEGPSLYDHLSGHRNLALGCTLQGLPKSRIDRVLESVGMVNDASRPVKQYSTGMKQRLNLAMALLSQPELLILDEPINGLDPAGIIDIRNLLKNLQKKENCTIFLSSHILSEIEKLCNYVAVIHKGRLLYQGGMQELLHKRENQGKYILEINDSNDGLKLINQHFSAYVENNVLIINTEDKKSIAKVIRILTDAGIDIYRAGPAENDLEGSFLELIQQ